MKDSRPCVDYLRVKDCTVSTRRQPLQGLWPESLPGSTTRQTSPFMQSPADVAQCPVELDALTCSFATADV